MPKLSAQTTTDEVVEGLDLHGKCFAITGASGGLGLETARALGKQGASLLLLARNKNKLALAEETLASENITNVHSYVMDLADLHSVKSAAEKILLECQSLNALINNAGLMACPLEHTKQGLESQFAVNHIGHFYFTKLLLPLLTAQDSSRVINLSSAGHKIAAFNFDDPNYLHREYDKWQAYGEAKSAVSLFSIGLQKRYQAKGLSSFAVHPGMIVTDLGRHLSNDDLKDLVKTGADIGGYKNTPQGAATSVWAACHPDALTIAGSYIEDCGKAPVIIEEQLGGVKAYAINERLADKLWLLSEQVVKDYEDATETAAS